MKRCIAVLLLLFSLAACGVQPAFPQALSIRDGRFEVDGVPKFLIFISYFDAMRRANLEGAAAFERDFGFFRGRIDGIRILVNWCDYRPEPPLRCSTGAPDSLIDGDGRIRDRANWSGSGGDPWSRLLVVLEAARRHGLLVNVTFTREGIDSPPTIERYADGITRVVRRLDAEHPGQYRHVLFDVQNEWTKDRATFSPAILKGLIAAVHAGRADAIAVGSQESTRAGAAASTAIAGNFDAVFFHDGRDNPHGSWYTHSRIAGDVGAMRAATSLPIVYDEPTAWCVDGQSRFPCRPSDDGTPAHFAEAAANAKKAGAALWTFHTRTAFDLVSGDYLSQASSAEQDTVLSLRPAVLGVSWGVEARAPAQPAAVR